MQCATAAGRPKRTARAVRNLERVATPSARLECGKTCLQIHNAVDENRTLPIDVIGEQDERMAVWYRLRQLSNYWKGNITRSRIGGNESN
jgi:hypothetical protein